MGKNMTIEKELEIRIKNHKFTILGAYYLLMATAEIDLENKKSSVLLPPPTIKEMAKQRMHEKLYQIKDDKVVFDSEYEIAWECMKDKLV